MLTMCFGVIVSLNYSWLHISLLKDWLNEKGLGLAKLMIKNKNPVVWVQQSAKNYCFFKSIFVFWVKLGALLQKSN